MGSHVSFYKNTLWQYGLQLIKYLLPLLIMPYLTRVLEPSGYAVYAYVVSFMGFAQTFIDFGFNLSGVKQIAALTDRREQEKVVGAISQARIVLCLATGMVCAAIGFFIPILRDNPLYTCFAFIAVCAKALAPDFLFQGYEKMGPLTTRYLISKSLSVLLTFAFVHSAADLIWVPVLDIITSVIALAWSFAAAKRNFGVGIIWVSWDSALRELGRSAYYCLSNMASAALSGATTLVIGLAIHSDADISYWSVAMTAISAVQSLYTPIVNSLYPHMVSGGDFAFAKRLCYISIPCVTIGSIVFFLLIDWIVLALGGEAYLPGAYVLRLLFPVVPLSFYTLYFGWPVLGAVGKVKELTHTTVITSIGGVVSLLVLWLGGFASIAAFAVSRSVIEALLLILRLLACRGVFTGRSVIEG